MDNAAFFDNPNEVNDILRKLANGEPLSHERFIVLRDYNGNKVGSLLIE